MHQPVCGMISSNASILIAGQNEQKLSFIEEGLREFGHDNLTITAGISGLAAIVEQIQPQAIIIEIGASAKTCLLYTSPSPRDQRGSRMPSSA